MSTLERAPKGRAVSTVDRVLSWRRQGTESSELMAPVLSAFRERREPTFEGR